MRRKSNDLAIWIFIGIVGMVAYAVVSGLAAADKAKADLEHRRGQELERKLDEQRDKLLRQVIERPVK